VLSESDSLWLTPAGLSLVAGKDGLLPGLPPRWLDSDRLLERPVFAFKTASLVLFFNLMEVASFRLKTLGRLCDRSQELGYCSQDNNGKSF
jgi:hypothetical protein